MIGQFLTGDPLGLAGGDTDIRRYVTNNPISRVDPLGLESVFVGFGGQGFLIQGTVGLTFSNGTTYLTTGANWGISGTTFLKISPSDTEPGTSLDGTTQTIIPLSPFSSYNPSTGDVNYGLAPFGFSTAASPQIFRYRGSNRLSFLPIGRRHSPIGRRSRIGTALLLHVRY